IGTEQPTARPPQYAQGTGAGSPPVLDRATSTHALSQSERDWYEVHRRLALAHASANVVDWLQHQHPDKPRPRPYAQLSVAEALASRSTRLRQATINTVPRKRS